MALLAHPCVLLAAGEDPTAAERDLDEATVLVERTTARGSAPFIHLERARLRGDEAARARHLREARRLFTATGASTRAAQVAAESGS
jgi:hypothetical protein